MATRAVRFATGALLVTALAHPAAAAGPDARIVAAAKAQDRAAVQALLKERADVNTRAADGSTALHWAAHWSNVDLLDLLLKARADVNAVNDHGVTPLILACENANPAAVERLLAAGADVNRAQTNGLTPLITAARTGNLEVIKALLARGADVNAAIAETGQTALMWATAEEHHDVMRTLIEGGANAHAKSTLAFTPLLFAARNGDIEAAKLLLDAGVNVNETGTDGTHALPLAIVSGNVDFALFLLDRGADANGRMGGVAALHAAAGPTEMWLRDWSRVRGVDYSRSMPSIPPARRIELIKVLAAHGGDLNTRITASTGVQGWLTLKRGAFEPFSVGTGNLRGATPLWVAAFDMHGQAYGGFSMGDGTGKSDKPRIISTLLELGADPNLTTDDKTTVLMAAAGLGHGTYLPGQQRGARTPDAEEAVRILVEVAKVDVNVINEAKFTALHGAAFKGLDEIIDYLVKRGADINARDFMGRTAYRMAEGSKQTFQFQEWPETAAFLKKLGADTTLGIAGREQERQRDAAGATAGKQ
jgi:serine/threonine-protein phosphatase 6 regulatory ankyrin repeat subunit B